VFLQQERLVIYDETCVSGGETRKGKNNIATKLVSTKERIDQQSGKRKVETANVTKEHITMVAGHTGAGDIAVPIFIVSSKSGLSDLTKQEIENVIPDWTHFGAVNGVKWTKKIVSYSEKGGITQNNIAGAMIKAFKIMFPDLANEDGRHMHTYIHTYTQYIYIHYIHTIRIRR